MNRRERLAAEQRKKAEQAKLKNKSTTATPQASQQAATAPPPAPSTTPDEVAFAALEAEESTSVKPEVPQIPADPAAWSVLWQDVLRARTVFDAARAVLEQRATGLRLESDRVAEELNAARVETERLALEREAIATGKAQWSEAKLQEEELLLASRAATEDAANDYRKRLEGLKTTEAELDARREALTTCQAEAAAGFMALKREILAPLEAELSAVRVAHDLHTTQMAADRKAWDAEKRRARIELDKELEVARSSRLDDFEKELAGRLQSREELLEGRERKLVSESAALRSGKAALAEREQELEAEIARRCRAETDRVGRELAFQRQRNTDLEQERQAAEEELAAVEALKRKLNMDPTAAVKRMKDLEREVRELQTKLDARPTADLQLKYEHLRQTCSDLEDRLTEVTERNAKLETQAQNVRIQVTEREGLVRERNVLNTHVSALEQRLVSLGKEVADAKLDAETQTPFPAARKMDDVESKPAQVDTQPIQLTAFVRDVRMAMAASDDPRYYAETDVRCFVAGLAASRIVLLEGPSGTGKTSLPRAFARALAGDREKTELWKKTAPIIEVQAGWRDRHDLIGHFNSFQKEYHETEFLQALYRAQCASQRDRPVFVVLDEMNLSHPEHYFADFLSKLQAGTNPSLELMPASVANAPQHLVDGRLLPISEQVWFVGTANMDETVKDFADKTYDRAHIMVLRRQPPAFGARGAQRALPISFSALTSAFEEAVASKQFADAKNALLAAMDKSLHQFLDAEFDIGWGNRVHTYMERFVPVYLAAGGRAGEAADHVLATKILRKLRGKHELTPEPLAALYSKVRDVLTDVDPQLKPTFANSAALALVGKERKKLDASLNLEKL